MVALSRDGRWPFIPLLIIRPIQLVFGLIVLGICGNIIDKYGDYLSGKDDIFGDSWSDNLSWASGMGVFIGLISMLWGATSIVLFFLAILLPLAVVIIDAFCTLFFLITVAGIGSSNFVQHSDKYCPKGGFFLEETQSKACGLAKGALAMSVLNMIFFIATTAYASMILYRTRKDLRGRKYNAGLPAASAKEGATDYVQPMQTMQSATPAQPAVFDPNTGGYYQQTTSPVYTVASPPPQQVQVVPGPMHEAPPQS